MKYNTDYRDIPYDGRDSITKITLNLRLWKNKAAGLFFQMGQYLQI